MKMLILTCSIVITALVCSASANEGYIDPDFYLENRENMSEIVNEMGLSEDDQREVADHVIDEDGVASGEGLRDSGMSDEGWEQVMDDANID